MFNEVFQDYSVKLINALAGKLGYILCSFSLLSFIVVALFPFSWNPPPPPQHNSAVFKPGQFIIFEKPGLIKSRSIPDWLNEAIILNQFTLDLRFRSNKKSQFGPARIFTISQDTRSRNVTIGQEKENLVIRLRTKDSSLNGMPQYNIDGVFQNSEWIHFTLRVKGKMMECMINGIKVFSTNIPENALENWNKDFFVSIGNEADGSRPWLGKISHLTVSVNGHTKINYLNKEYINIPSSYTSWPAIEPLFPLFKSFGRQDSLSDRLDPFLNLFCFIPIGFFLAMLHGRRGSFFLAILICGFMSLLVEVLQLFFDLRVSSIRDLTLNLTGASLGACCSRLFVRYFARSLK